MIQIGRTSGQKPSFVLDEHHNFDSSFIATFSASSSFNISRSNNYIQSNQRMERQWEIEEYQMYPHLNNNNNIPP